MADVHEVVVGAGVVVLGVSSLVSAWLLWRTGSRWAAGLLAVAGLAVPAGVSLVSLDAVVAGRTIVLAAGTVLYPLAQVGYPRLRGPRGVAAVGAAGVLAAGVPPLVVHGALDACSYLLAGTVCVVAWWRAETGDPATRRAVTWSATAWLSVGLLIGFAMFLSEGGSPSGDVRIVTELAPPLLAVGPLGMALGVVRSELVDVRGVVTGVVVGFTTFATYLAVAMGVLATVEVVGGRRPGSAPTVVLCALLAFGVRPTVVMLRGVVDRLLFGDRPAPLVAATQVADRIGEDPAVALHAVREALVLPYASLRVGDRELAVSGTPVTHTRTLPLRLGGRQDGDALGEVVVGLRPGDLTLAREDADVLRIVAPLLAQTIRAQALAEELRESRGAAIAAIEEERRRLRRDLHDGLGPTLTGVAYAADAAHNHLEGVAGTDAASSLVERLRADVGEAVGEIRRLVEGLRPPVLDQLGLVAAVRQHAQTLHTATGAPIAVEVLAPEDVPPLSAAAEVASYRIVVEALTNVARHAAATSARVSLAVEGSGLRLVVEDDGVGVAAWRPGVGLSSMRERAEQLGGRLDAAPGSRGGRVSALIPL